MQISDLSLLSPLGYQASDCGYCKGQDSSQRTPKSRAAYYARSRVLTVETYQALIDRGWRRSGLLLYKPDVFRACCPHYTIRLPAAHLKPSRDQRQAINRWNNYVLGQDYISEVAKRFPKTKDEKRKETTTFDFVQNLHLAEIDRLKPIQAAHRFEVTLEPDDLTTEKYELFVNYQTHVHHESPEEISSSSFKRFLCSSPLQRRSSESNHCDRPMGSYHQCYRLDGRLIAMGVLDLLPHAVSGVYFIYHSDFEKWSFGKLSALREAALALEKGYEYYYMGYYIHNCTKMKYKCDYKPQYVLDPLSYEWHPFEGKMKSLMDSRRFVSLSTHANDQGSAQQPETVRGDSAAALAGDTDDRYTGPDSETWKYHSPAEAAESGESLLSIRMPGVLDTDQLDEHIELDTLQVHLGNGLAFKTQNLMTWDDEPDITNSSTLKGIVAEFAACLGPEIVKMIAIDFSRG